MTDTPRTNSAIAVAKNLDLSDEEIVRAKFARDLEDEVGRLREELENYTEFPGTMSALAANNDRLQAEVERLKAELDKFGDWKTAEGERIYPGMKVFGFSRLDGEIIEIEVGKLPTLFIVDSDNGEQWDLPEFTHSTKELAKAAKTREAIGK